MIAGDLAKQYLRRYSTTSTLQIARILSKEHPLIFGDIEQARQVVRYYRGAQGKENRQYLKDTEFIRPIEQALQDKYNPYGLPPAETDDWSPVSLPFSKGRGLVLADLHIPYHDIEAITATFDWAKNSGYTDFVLFDGDISDCYQLSRFEKDPRKRAFKSELDDFKSLLDATSKVFPKAQIILKYGNHDNSLEFYLRRRAPELLGLETYIMDDYIGLKARGIFTVPHDVPIKVGKLNILHGHELQSLSTAVNPSRGAYLKALECVLIAHSHRTSQHAEMSMSGRLDTAWSIGCLCQLHPEYARLNKWNHGCAGLEVDKDDFEIDNKRIIKGRVR
jgi:predicted phosphodiesterase